VFGSVAELFAVLSTPIRLKTISELCHGEKSVSAIEMDGSAAMHPHERLLPRGAR
jgi:DNA-binding transcriptional ArsR family regulator